MYRKFFQRLNILIYVLIAFFAAILQSTVFKFFPFDYFHPDFIFLMAVYFGYKKNVLEGGLLIIISSKILEVSSSAPNHFLMTTYLYTFVIATALSKIFVMKNTFGSKVTITSILFVFMQLGIFMIFKVGYHTTTIWKHQLTHFLPGLLTQALIASSLFALFQEIDLRTYSDLHSEDEYDLNKGFE